MFFGNLMLLALNLLPALPLDGGRLLALALSLRYDLATQMKVMRVLGMILGLGLAGLAVASAVWWGAANFSLAAAGCFLIYASQVGATTEAMAALRQFLDRRNRLETSGMMRGEILAVLEQQPLRAVLPHLAPGTVYLPGGAGERTLRMRGSWMRIPCKGPTCIIPRETAHPFCQMRRNGRSPGQISTLTSERVHAIVVSS